jgi:hypothetical protein
MKEPQSPKAGGRVLAALVPALELLDSYSLFPPHERAQMSGHSPPPSLFSSAPQKGRVDHGNCLKWCSRREDPLILLSIFITGKQSMADSAVTAAWAKLASAKAVPSTLQGSVRPLVEKQGTMSHEDITFSGG